MKKLILISLILGGLFLSGCSTQKGLSQSELFEKKQECASYQYEIEKDINKEYGNESDRLILKLEEIFYSRKRNSCLYSVYALKENHKANHIYDYFTKEDIGGYDQFFLADQPTVEEKKSLLKNEIKFSEKLKELKGE